MMEFDTEEFVIRELSIETAEDFLEFFDHRAFCDNPDWADCYCCFYYFTGKDSWEQRSGADNRKESITLIERGRMNGYLAYIGGRPAGWLNVDDINNYPRLLENNQIKRESGKKTASVVCFVIDPDQRRKGIASRLLKQACADFEKKGYDFIEAYPQINPEGDAANYHGPLKMYLSAGFEISGENASFHIVRRSFK